MRGRFIEGANDTLAIEFSAETDDERLLLKIWDSQMRPNNLLRVSGWIYPQGELAKLRAHIEGDTQSKTLPTDRGVVGQTEAAVDRHVRVFEAAVDRHVRVLTAELRAILEPTSTLEWSWDHARSRVQGLALKLEAFKDKMPHQVAAEFIVQAIVREFATTANDEAHPMNPIVHCWQQLANKTKAEIMTLWIEAVERALRSK